jgi:two-component system, NtrC family, sensor kinase
MLHFDTDFDPDLPKIEVVPQDIGRVILNLVNNAFQAVHEKSTSVVEKFHETTKITPPPSPSPLS